MAYSSTPQTPTLTYTPTVTFTPSSTYTPSNTPTGTLPPTATDSLQTRVYGKLVTATPYTLTPTYTPSLTFTPTNTATPRPTRTRRPVQPRATGNPADDPAQPTAPIIAPTLERPQYTPLPPGWQPSPIWNGQPLPTIDYSTATPSPTVDTIILPTLESIVTLTETPTPTLTMIPTETPAFDLPMGVSQ